MIIIIPYEAKLMLLSDSAYLPQGVEHCLIPSLKYVDVIPYSAYYLSERVVDLLILYEAKLM